MKLLNRVINYIEITNEKLLKTDSSNLKAVLLLYIHFAMIQIGTEGFFLKLESLLEKDIVKKKY